MLLSQRIRPPPNPFLELSSLPLSPPHRTLSPLYSDLLASDAWLARFSLLQTLGEPDNADGFAGSGHRVVKEAYGSTGCVNAMDWEEGELGRLASAGDDTKICIWKPGLDRREPSDDPVEAPFTGYGLEQVLDTGHRANIFSVKWAPGMDHRLFSCAGDCTVRVYDISLSTNPALVSSTVTPPSPSIHRPWTHHEAGSACVNVFRCHTDRVKRVATEASPDVFLTCSEDGTVRQHDLRMHHVCRTSRFGRSASSNCPPPLAEYSRGLSLYSLSVSKLRPHLFVVAGTSSYAFLHDRRMLRAPMEREWGITPTEGQLTQCVRRFGVPKENGKGDITNHIVATKLSPANPRDLIVSYSEVGIYLFDTDGETYTRPPPPPKEDDGGKGRKRRKDNGIEVDERSPGRRLTTSAVVMSEESRSQGTKEVKRGLDPTVEAATQPSTGAERVPPWRSDDADAAEGEGDATAEAALADFVMNEADGDEESGEEETLPPAGDGGEGRAMVEEHSMGVASDSYSDGDDDDDDDTEEEFVESPFVPCAHSDHHQTVPLVAPLARYTGHANSQTVKDVNFAFNGSMVVSGSDDGNFFFWRKDDQELVGIFKGDSSVVNVMAPHPRLPLLAISGIDETVRLFGPTTEASAAEKANLIRDAEAITERNRRGAASNRLGSVMSPDAILRLLAGRAGMLGDDGGDNDEADGEGAGGGGRFRGRGIRVVINADEGDGQAVDCAVM
ncbi:hypothetical protein JCM21900_004134 [Sporobolomyces salmonicolor]